MDLALLIKPWNGDAPGWLHLFLILAVYIATRSLFIQAPALLLVKFSKAFRRRVFRLPYKSEQLVRELKSLILVTTVDAVLLTSLVKSGLAVTDNDHVVSTFLFIAVFYEIWFYFYHRLLHTRLLFRFHHAHHLSKVSSPLTAMTFSAVERIIMVGGFAVGLAPFSHIYSISFLGVAIYFAFNFVFNVAHHSNIEIYSPRWGALLSWWSTPTHHSLHHARLNGNYGLFTRFLDRWLGTEFADYRLLQERAYNGQGLTALNQRLITKQLSDIVNGGEIALTAVSTADLVPQFVYEDPEVRRWLKEQIATFSTSESFTGENWYIARGDSADLIGPLTSSSLCEIRAALQPSDIIFSLTSRRVMSIDCIPDKANGHEETFPSLPYFSRKLTREEVSCVVRVETHEGILNGFCIDLSGGGAAIYMKSEHDLKEDLSIEFTHGEDQEIIKMRAKAVSRRPLRHGYRYGLRFEKLERPAARKFNQFVAKNLKSAVAV